MSYNIKDFVEQNWSVKYIYLILTCLLSVQVDSNAQNLVPNPSFEEIIECPYHLHDMRSLKDWFILPEHEGSANQFHSCATEERQQVPENAWGYQHPATGEGYIGFIQYWVQWPEYREYTYVKLDTVLSEGTTYTVSLKYSLPNESKYASNHFGIYFTDTVEHSAEYEGPFSRTPHLSTSSFMTDTSGWNPLEWHYTAQGFEQYMLIGSFLSDSVIPLIQVLGDSIAQTYSGCCYAYLYIDDVSITPCTDIQVDLGNDTSFCHNVPYLLDASVPNGQYTWQDGTTNSTFLATESGIYQIEVLVDGCIVKDSIAITYYSDDLLHIGGDSTFCTGDSVELDAEFPAAIAYEWSVGSTHPNLIVQTPGQYWVTVDVGECSIFDTINVTQMDPPDLDLGADTFLCDGTSWLIDLHIPNASYTWQDSSSFSSYNITHSGTYWVHVVQAVCEVTDSISIIYLDPPTIDLGPDTILCKDTPYLLDATNPMANYYWQDMSTQPTYEVFQSGTYSVSVDRCGVVSDTVEVQYGNCNCKLFMPTIFTPNQDGRNDKLKPMFNCDIHRNGLEDYAFRVYNRWGEKVFATSFVEDEWDGTSEGITLETSVFTYVVSYQFGEIEHAITGVILLLR